MKKIAILGGGKSSTALINYLITRSSQADWQIRVGDIDPVGVQKKLGTNDRLVVEQFNVDNDTLLLDFVTEADLVVSLLPARFHPIVAEACVDQGTDMITASYISEEMRALDAKAKDKGVLLLNEMGVDPGIDHMSAMEVIESIRAEGGQVTAFESFTGGLLAPESEKDNPWRYKFTWNPRNVVLAGQGIVKFIQQRKYKYIPYHRLFRRTEIIEIPGWGRFEGYANRDSLKYMGAYGLEDVQTMYRGTLRRPGFCRSWNALIQIGATDDSYVMHGSENMTYREFINSFLSYNKHDSVELKLAHYLKLYQDDPEMEKLQWLGIFDDTPVGLKDATPAQILQKILEDKWSLDEDDRDMIVMWHRFNFKDAEGVDREKHASMVVLGDDMVTTAMAKTVGYPLAIGVELMLEKQIPLTGVHLPVLKEIYGPVLKGLQPLGIHFEERDVEPSYY